MLRYSEPCGAVIVGAFRTEIDAGRQAQPLMSDRGEPPLSDTGCLESCVGNDRTGEIGSGHGGYLHKKVAVVWRKGGLPLALVLCSGNCDSSGSLQPKL